MFCCAQTTSPQIERRARPEGGIQKLPGPVEELENVFGEDFLRPCDDTAGSDRYTHARYVGKDVDTESWQLNNVGFPAAICQCSTVSQVQAVANYAREHCLPAGVPLAVACGRHSHTCMPDNAIVCDLSGMKTVEVLPDQEIAKVSAGTLAKELDAACAKYDVAAVVGDSQSTGIMGQSLHGGHGVMERKIGMAVDNILEARIVTADGQLRKCSKSENSDLFWGVCGCGSAFGIAVELTVRVVKLPTGSMLPKAQTVHVPLGSMGLPGRADLIKRFRGFFDKKENADTHGVIILPGGGPVIEECVWLEGTEDTLARAQKDWAEHNKTTGWFTLNKELKEKHYHSDIQLVPEIVKPQAAYIKTLELSGLPDAAIDVLDKCMDSSMTPHAKDCTIILVTANSVSATYPKDSNAYFHREAAWHMILIGGVPLMLSGAQYEAKMAESTKWACEVHEKLTSITPSIALGGYSVMEGTHAEQIYGSNLARLRELKGTYDSANLFAMNAKILEPASASPVISSIPM